MNQDSAVARANEKRKNMFFSGVVILTVANLLIKVIGLIFKIPLTNLIGDEGMGYFNTAYNVYAWIYMVSTAGLPIAVSIIISDCRSKGKYRELKNAYKITMRLFIAIGALGLLMMCAIAAFFNFNGNKAYLSMLGIAPTLFFICIASAVRGFFQGYQNMIPTAVSQVIEALGKLILGLLFTNIAIGRGYSVTDAPYVVAAFAIFGVTIGVFLSMAFLIISKKLYNTSELDVVIPDDTVSPSKSLAKKLVFIAIPITISASVLSLTSLIDTAIIPSRLMYSLGISHEEAMAMYGNYSALAVSMFNMPPALIYPISYSIIPVISSAIAQKDDIQKRVVCNSAFKIAALISIPCALGMSTLAKPILKMFFNADSAEKAAPLLSVLALSIFFLGMLSISNAVLQSHGHERKPVISMAAGAVVKLLTSIILIGIPGINIYGAPIGTFLCYFVAISFNMYFVAKHCKVKPKIVSTFVKPLIAAVLCAATAFFAYRMATAAVGYGRLSTLLAIAAAVVVYVISIFLVRGIERTDVELLPKGKKIAALLHKLKLVN